MSAAKQRKVGVVVVTYNASRFLDACFGSLAKADRTGLDVEVICVDNASKDGTVGTVREKWPDVTVVVNRTNTGFAGGNNQGIRIAQERGAEFVYLLNHDAEAEARFLLEAVRVMDADERIGAVQSLLLLSPERDRINSAGNAIHFLGFGYCTEYRRPLASWRHSGVAEIAYASGASALYRSSALAAVGAFDETLFLYHEDLDLGWRLRLAGYSNMLAPHSVVWHAYEFSRSIAKYYYMERNRYIVLMKNLRLWSLALLAPWLLLSEAALLVAAVRGGWWREKLRVYGYFLRPSSWSHVARERARVTLLRTVGDREIVRLFTGAIRFQDVSGPFTTYVANPLMTVLWTFLRLCII